MWFHRIFTSKLPRLEIPFNTITGTAMTFLSVYFQFTMQIIGDCRRWKTTGVCHCLCVCVCVKCRLFVLQTMRRETFMKRRQSFKDGWTWDETSDTAKDSAYVWIWTRSKEETAVNSSQRPKRNPWIFYTTTKDKHQISKWTSQNHSLCK